MPKRAKHLAPTRRSLGAIFAPGLLFVPCVGVVAPAVEARWPVVSGSPGAVLKTSDRPECKPKPADGRRSIFSQARNVQRFNAESHFKQCELTAEALRPPTTVGGRPHGMTFAGLRPQTADERRETAVRGAGDGMLGAKRPHAPGGATEYSGVSAAVRLSRMLSGHSPEIPTQGIETLPDVKTSGVPNSAKRRETLRVLSTFPTGTHVTSSRHLYCSTAERAGPISLRPEKRPHLARGWRG